MTSKPLSTITYCSNKFLNKTLKQLEADGIVTFWFYINHQPDVDDKVPHTHLRIELGRPVDPEKIRKIFTQKKKKGKDENSRMFRPSKLEDAILYFIHDQEYLIAKEKPRNIFYKLSDMHTNNKKELEGCYFEAREWLRNTILKDKCTEDKIRNGDKISDLIEQGLITSKNVWRMKIFKDECIDKKREASYNEFAELSSRIREELEDVHKLRSELLDKKKHLDFQIEFLEKAKKEQKELNKQIKLDLDNPFMKGG